MDTPILVWIRPGDLRTHDNLALSHAAETGHPVLAIYIQDTFDTGTSCPGAASNAWLEKSLESFSKAITQSGFGWCIKKGRPLEILKHVIQETKASTIFWNRRYEPDLIAIDKEIKQVLTAESITVTTFQGNILIEPWKIFNKSGKPYQVFTQFWKGLLAIEPETHEKSLSLPKKPYSSTQLESLLIPDLELTPKHLHWSEEMLSTWQIGEQAALEKLYDFVEKNVDRYGIERDIPGNDMTSHMSPYLHFGEISIRTIWNRVIGKKDLSHLVSSANGRETYLRELGWREFAMHLLFHFPHTAHAPLRADFERFPFRHDSMELSLWQKGKTGVPIIDAGMRQLWQTGWMHNRVRMIVGSYLVKHLLHSWKEGFAWFWDTLVDADLANNTLGWQWVSGCGADAAPYFRIFNPVLQGEKFDPKGIYIRKFVPELDSVPDTYIHKPWEASPELLRSWGIILDTTYPKPLIDLGFGRKRALEAFTAFSGNKTPEQM